MMTPEKSFAATAAAQSVELDSGKLRSLAYEIFLESLQNLKLIKVCPLVCRSWNRTASKVMQRRSSVTINEDCVNRLGELRDLILRREQFHPLWPRPFKHVNIIASNFSDDCFIELINMPDTVMTLTCSLLSRGRKNQFKVIHDFLTQNAGRIVELNIEKAVCEWTSDLTQIYMPVLKRVSLESNSDERVLRFIQNVILTSKTLEVIELIGDEPLIPIRMLAENKFENLRTLLVSSDMPSAKDWVTLATANKLMPALKELKWHVWECDINENFDHGAKHFAIFVGSVSETIEILYLNVMRVEILPCVPKLREITLSCCECSMKDFSPNRFPSLEKITFLKWLSSWRTPEEDFEMHPGVKSFTVELMNYDFCSWVMNDVQNFAEDYMSEFLKNLRCQFPRIVTLSILDIPLYKSNFFLDVNQFFPLLKRLEVNGCIDFPSICGNEFEDADDPCHVVRKESNSNENVEERNVFRDFEALECVSFGVEVELTNEVIRSCLSSFPGLKCMEFYWNDNLSAQAVWDYLGNLKNVLIKSQPGSREDYQLLQALPNVDFA